MLLKLRPEWCAAVGALALGACASQTPELTTAAMPPQASPVVATPASSPAPLAQTQVARATAETVSRLPSKSAYQMTASDLELDCKQLTGRMAVRIVQLRDYQSRTQTTSTSRTLQVATTSMLGGTYEGSDPDGRYARDLAQLQAYNERLAEKNCPNFDLESSLDPNEKDPPHTRRVKKS